MYIWTLEAYLAVCNMQLKKDNIYVKLKYSNCIKKIMWKKYSKAKFELIATEYV